MAAEFAEAVLEAMATQRAIRRYRPDPVPRELIWQVVEAATRAPSGGNRQPWGFVVVEEADARRRIADALVAHMAENEDLRTYFERGTQSTDSSERRIFTGAVELARDMAKAPVLIVPCLRTTSARPSLLSGSSIYPAVQNLLLAARALGLGTVLTTLNSGIEPVLREVLALPEEAKPVALIPLGFPDGRFGPTRRRPVAEVTHWGSWGATEAR